MMNGKITIKIGAEKTVLDIDELTTINDISKGMYEVSSLIANVGSILAEAEREKKEVDASYRKWRAAKAVKKTAKENKVAEHKIKASIESNPLFEKYKIASAQCEYNCIALSNLIIALREKSQNLRSLGANARAEMETIGISTPDVEQKRRVENRKKELQKHQKGLQK